MNIGKAIVEMAGADYRQWRALALAMRASGRRGGVSRMPRAGGADIGFIAYAVIGIVVAGLALRVPALSDAPWVLSFAMSVLAASLFVDYAPALVRDGSAHFRHVRHLPISDRMFFLCRLANLLRWTAWVTALVAAPTAALAAIREGPAALAGYLLALPLSALFVACSVATLFAVASRFAAAQAWRRAVAYCLLFVAAVAFCLALGAPLLAIGPDYAQAATVHLLDAGLPAHWFSAFVDLAAGVPATRREVHAALAVAGTCAAFLALARAWRASPGPSAAGVDSRFGGARTAGESLVRTRLGRTFRPLAALPAEARAADRLVRAHLRRDAGFRLRALSAVPVGVVPLIVAALHALGFEPIAQRLDGFMVLGLVHLAAIAVPLSWLGAIRCSTAHRAAWVLAVAPADIGRIVFWSGASMAAYVGLPFFALIGATLLLVLGCALSTLAHALSLSLASCFVLGIALAINPAAPFSEPPADRPMRSARSLPGHLLGGFLTVSLLPAILSAASLRLDSAAGLAALLIAAIAASKILVERRARRMCLRFGADGDC